MGQVLQKYIAFSGYSSRREAELLIREDRVEINGKIASLGARVEVGDEVKIDGKKIDLPSEKIYIKLNKPLGYVSTNRRFEGEKSVFELVGEEHQSLHIVGRLDKNSRGLVILTNDGDFTQEMTHPSKEHEKEYLVTITNHNSRFLSKELNDIETKFVKGLDIGEGDGVVRAKRVEYLQQGKFRLVLTEGKKRQIRRMFQVIGLEVKDLLRLRIASIKLGDLKEGKWKPIKKV